METITKKTISKLDKIDIINKKTNITNATSTQPRKKIIKGTLIFLLVVELVIFGIVYGYKTKSIQENKALEDNNFTLTNEIETLNISIENLYNDIANTQIEIETLSNSNNELETQITSLESELSYYNEQINLLGGDMYE